MSLFGQIKTERKRVENFFRSSNFISDINWPKIKAVDVIDSHLDCFNNKCHYYPFRGQRTKDRPNMNGHGQKVFGSHDFGLGYRFGTDSVQIRTHVGTREFPKNTRSRLIALVWFWSDPSKIFIRSCLEFEVRTLG